MSLAASPSSSSSAALVSKALSCSRSRLLSLHVSLSRFSTASTALSPAAAPSHSQKQSLSGTAKDAGDAAVAGNHRYSHLLTIRHPLQTEIAKSGLDNHTEESDGGVKGSSAHSREEGLAADDSDRSYTSAQKHLQTTMEESLFNPRVQELLSRFEDKKQKLAAPSKYSVENRVKLLEEAADSHLKFIVRTKTHALFPLTTEQDLMYHVAEDPLMKKLVNCIMYDGKKQLAQQIVFDALVHLKKERVGTQVPMRARLLNPTDPDDAQRLSQWYSRTKEIGTLRDSPFNTAFQGMALMHAAIENIKPVVECRSTRVSGSVYQVPYPVQPRRQISLAIKWLIKAARERKSPHSYSERLAQEILAASKNDGAAVKKRNETHKIAESNRAFAHFRWASKKK